MSMAELALLFVKPASTSNGHSSVWGFAVLVIIPIAMYLRVRQGRQAPNSQYTPTQTDTYTGQDPMAPGFAVPSDADTYDPNFPPAPAPPPFTYGHGTPSTGIADSFAPAPPAFVPGLPQFNAPPPPISVPHAVPGSTPGAVPGTVPGAIPGSTAPIPVGLPAAGAFSSQSLRLGYGISFFMTALVIDMFTGGPVRSIGLIESRTLVPQMLVINLVVVAALFLGVRAIRVGISYDADGVLARSIFQSRRWTWPRLFEIEIENALVNSPLAGRGMGQNQMRKMLRIIEVDGKFVVLRALTAPRGGPDDRSWLDDAASALNAQILARRRASSTAAGTAADPVSWSTN